MDLRRHEKFKVREMRRMGLLGKLDAIIFPYKSSDFFYVQFLNAQCVSAQELSRFPNKYVSRKRGIKEYIQNHANLDSNKN